MFTTSEPEDKIRVYSFLSENMPNCVDRLDLALDASEAII